MDRALALSVLDAEINMLTDMRVGDRLVTTPRRFRLYVQQVLTFCLCMGLHIRSLSLNTSPSD